MELGNSYIRLIRAWLNHPVCVCTMREQCTNITVLFGKRKDAMRWKVRYHPNSMNERRIGVSDGSSPKSLSLGRLQALKDKIELKLRPSPDPSKKFKHEPCWAPNFYYIKTPICYALFKNLSHCLSTSQNAKARAVQKRDQPRAESGLEPDPSLPWIWFHCWKIQ